MITQSIDWRNTYGQGQGHLTPSLTNSKVRGFDWNSTLAAYIEPFFPSQLIFLYEF